MKRLLLAILLCGGALLSPLAAQEPEGKKETSFAEEHELALKWVNFLILAGGIYYLISKNAGPLYAARSRQIRSQMMLAEEAREKAEKRAAEIDQRMASLQSDIAALQAEARREAENETERMRRQAAADIAKIRVHAEQEIASAQKGARAELKQYSAQLALNLAAQKLQGQMSPQLQESLLRGFVRDLDNPSVKAQAN